jgi:hypothetical protein
MTDQLLCKACGQPIREHAWRDPTRCLGCYLALKIGQVHVCVERDVRVGDCMPGGLVTKRRQGAP